MRLFVLVVLLLFGCMSAMAQRKEAEKYLLRNDQLKHSFIGVSIYNPETGKVLYGHNAFRYFTPASNTKLYSFYAGLKYLGDSTTGIQYQISRDTLYIRGTGDPTFLHPDFDSQPVYVFLKNSQLPVALLAAPDENKIFGPGWAWDDYNGAYQPERSAFPVYGNVAWFSLHNGLLHVMPSYFSTQEKLVFDDKIPAYGFKVKRERLHNLFHYNIAGPAVSKVQQVPFITFDNNILISLLQDTLHRKVYHSTTSLPEAGWKQIGNAPLDSMLKNMMHRSDNFYAEQTDAMVSMQLFDELNTGKLIKYLLDNDLKNLPDEPAWVDGSGLSRYNLFSPADMVTLLTLLYRTFSHDRIFDILPSGGEGTLKHFYRDMKGRIFAKTGSLSNNVTLSGYLITKRNHTLIFSIMINHCMSPLNVGRHAMEDFLRAVYEKY